MIGTMTDASTLTDRLAMMPDNMLPRLAQQYKTDAITLSLILSEKNRRDRVRQSMQAQAGAQPQPKVNDQIVASMQQPSPGIAGLPAPTMQGMADGGIAGYAEGGEVEGYAGGGSIPRYAGVPEFGSVVRSGATNPNAAFIEFLKQMGVSTQEFIQSSPQAQTALREMFETGATAYNGGTSCSCSSGTGSTCCNGTGSSCCNGTGSSCGCGQIWSWVVGEQISPCRRACSWLGASGAAFA